jgi:AcrR family transcriptional regulator
MPETRARILEAALRLFVTDGYQTSTVRDLAAEVGLTSAALYYYFPSKEACLEALVTPYLDAVDRVLERHPIATNQRRRTRRSLLLEYLAVLLQSPDLTRLVDRDPGIYSHAEFGPRIEKIVDGFLLRLAGAEATPGGRLRATAALGALRRPVLRTDIDVEPLAEELVDLAMCMFDG